MVLCLGLGVLVAGLGSVGFAAYKGLCRTDFFQITAIEIKGQRRTSKAEIFELSGVDVHTNLLALNASRVAKKISSSPWVETVRLERDWPNRLTITVKERVPVALINLKDGLHFVDAQGVAFVAASPPEDMDFPVITGLEKEEDATISSRQTMRDALTFLGYAGRGNSILPKQNVSEVCITPSEEMVVFLVDRAFPIYLGKGDWYMKYNRLTKVLYWLYKKNEFQQVTYIRFDQNNDRVIVGEQDSFPRK